MIVDINGLSKQYQRGEKVFYALSKVSLQASKGEFIGIHGPSGSGKSTLFHIINGLLRPDTGTVSLLGKDITQMSHDSLTSMRRVDIGCILQGENLLQNFTVEENIYMPLYLNGARNIEERRVTALLEEFGLAAMRKEYPSALSGGEQRRVSIIRGFVHRPKLVTADEPTNSLDPENAALVMSFLKKMSTAEGVTLLVSTHDHSLLSYASRKYEMRNGKLSETF